MNNFYDWFTTFLEEKQVDMSEFITKDIQIGDVCQAICYAPKDEQKDIKKMLVLIDFKNGDITHYLKHLSQALTTEKVNKNKGIKS